MSRFSDAVSSSWDGPQDEKGHREFWRQTSAKETLPNLQEARHRETDLVVQETTDALDDLANVIPILDTNVIPILDTNAIPILDADTWIPDTEILKNDLWPFRGLDSSLRSSQDIPWEMSVDTWSCRLVGSSIQIMAPKYRQTDWAVVKVLVAQLRRQDFDVVPRTTDAPWYLRLKPDKVLSSTYFDAEWVEQKITYVIDVVLNQYSTTYPDDFRWTLQVSLATADRLPPEVPLPPTIERQLFPMNNVSFKNPVLNCEQRDAGWVCSHATEMWTWTMVSKTLEDAIWENGTNAIIFQTTSSLVAWLPGVTKLPWAQGADPVYEVRFPLSKPYRPPHKLAHPWSTMLYTLPTGIDKPIITIMVKNIWPESWWAWAQAAVEVRMVESSVTFSDPQVINQNEWSRESLTTWTISLRSHHYAVLDEYNRPLYLTHMQRAIPDEENLVCSTSWNGQKIQIIHNTWKFVYAEITTDILAQSKPVKIDNGRLKYTLRVPAVQGTGYWDLELLVDDRNKSRNVVVGALTIIQKDPDYKEFSLTDTVKKKFKKFSDALKEWKDNLVIREPSEIDPDGPYFSDSIVPVRWWLYAQPTLRDESWRNIDVIGYDSRPLPLDPATDMDVDGLTISQWLLSWTTFVIKKRGSISTVSFTLDPSYTINKEFTVTSSGKQRRIKPILIAEWILWFALAPPSSELSPSNSERAEIYEAAQFRYPIDTHVQWYATITSVVGLRRLWPASQLKQHDGIDVAIPQGTPLNAVAPWKVVLAEQGRAGWWYGWRVVVEHSVRVQWQVQTLWTVYAHLSSVTVRNGSKVQAWSKLWLSWGEKGTPWSWHSTWPHLHFETWGSGSSSVADARRYALSQANKTREARDKYRLDPLQFFSQIDFKYSANCSNCPPETSNTSWSRGLRTVPNPPEIPTTSPNVLYPVHFERDRHQNTWWAAIEQWLYPKDYTARKYSNDLSRHASVNASITILKHEAHNSSAYIQSFKQKSASFFNAVSAKTWVPTDLMYTVACAETHMWATGIAPDTNNLFNIRPWSLWLWPYYQSPSLPTSHYRVYISREHSVMDFARLMNSSRYKATVLKQWLTLEQRLQAMVDAWYATDPQYVTKAMNVARSHGLIGSGWWGGGPVVPETVPPVPGGFTRQQMDAILQLQRSDIQSLWSWLSIKTNANEQREIKKYQRWVVAGRYGDPYILWRLTHTGSGASTKFYLISPNRESVYLDGSIFTITKQSAGDLFKGVSSTLVFPGWNRATVTFTVDAAWLLTITTISSP
jgi:murein DD-endopeptidase MepM/ murein hydrolase activator NlpD